MCVCAFTGWWLSTHPDTKALVISATETQAARAKREIDEFIQRAYPHSRPRQMNFAFTKLDNGSELLAVGATADTLRGWHPDLVIGDDPLAESAASQPEGQAKTGKLWAGTVGGMMPGKTIITGSAMHETDQLHVLKPNRAWLWRRYSIEADTDLMPLWPDSLCVETNEVDSPASSPVVSTPTRGAGEQSQSDRPEGHLGMWPTRGAFGDSSAHPPDGPPRVRPKVNLGGRGREI